MRKRLLLTILGISMVALPATAWAAPPTSTAAPTVSPAAVPTANLSFVEAIPAAHLSTTTSAAGTLTTGRQVELTCTVHSSGPDTVTGLKMRLFVATQNSGAWSVRLSPTGPSIGGGTLVAIGSLAAGQSKSVNLWVTPVLSGVHALIGCNVDQVAGEKLVEPPFDRAGDFGAALGLTGVAAPATTPAPPTASGTVLAATGAKVTTPLLIGVSLLIVGGIAVFFGRRGHASTTSD